MSKYVLYSCCFDPFSRKVRFFLEENCIKYEIKEIKFWERDKNFIRLSPAGETPVLKDLDNGKVICDSYLICNYLGKAEKKIKMELNYSDLMGLGGKDEDEIERLHMWFDKKFYNEVTNYIIEENFLNTFKKNGKTVNLEKISIALDNFKSHIKYIEYLLNKRKWLAGESISIADIACATNISILDYLGFVEWEKHIKFKEWYISIKQKIGFRSILNDKIYGFEPSQFYKELDF